MLSCLNSNACWISFVVFFQLGCFLINCVLYLQCALFQACVCTLGDDLCDINIRSLLLCYHRLINSLSCILCWELILFTIACIYRLNICLILVDKRAIVQFNRFNRDLFQLLALYCKCWSAVLFQQVILCVIFILRDVGNATINFNNCLRLCGIYHILVVY
jgi:hypothetical protein